MVAATRSKSTDIIRYSRSGIGNDRIVNGKEVQQTTDNKLTYNKSFKYVPALRASTGHKTAAQFYAA